MGSPLRFLHLAPVAIAAATVTAALEASGLSFLAIYATQLGRPEMEATQLMTGDDGGSDCASATHRLARRQVGPRLVVCLAAAAVFVTVMGKKGGLPRPTDRKGV